MDSCCLHLTPENSCLTTVQNLLGHYHDLSYAPVKESTMQCHYEGSWCYWPHNFGLTRIRFVGENEEVGKFPGSWNVA